VDEGSAAIMTWMLESVVNNGTGQPAALPDRQVAGKTGTSEKARDLWFVGYIPQLVTGVWLGYDDDEPTGGSSALAADVWRQFMREATKDVTVAKFPDLPKNLDDRKGSIKAVAVKPNRRYDKAVEKESSRRRRDDGDDGGGGGSRSYSEPAPEPRYYAPEPAPAPYYAPEPEPARDPEPYYAPEPEPAPPAAVVPPPAAAEPAPPADPGGADPGPPQ
jgi:penicillin-binding protein 1A